jgi:hypothetical protein
MSGWSRRHHELGDIVPSSSFMSTGRTGANGISTSSRTEELVDCCSDGSFFSSVGLDEALVGAAVAFTSAEEDDVDDEGIDACACAALLLFLLV